MSAQAVQTLFDLAGRTAMKRALDSLTVIAAGPKTRAKLEQVGIRSVLVPAEFSSKGIVRMLAARNPNGKKIIIPRSAAANKYIRQALGSLGMSVHEVPLYTVRTLSPSDEWKDFVTLLKAGKVDVVVFTSASNVAAFFEILEELQERIDLDSKTLVVSIGPFTSEELRKRNVECHESRVHTVKGTLELAAEVLGNSF
jgi:uroporphyrinogen-III synthase